MRNRSAPNRRLDHTGFRFTLVTLAGIGLLLFVVRPETSRVEPPIPEPALLKTALRKVKTSVYERDRLKLRIAANEIKVTQPRLLGPIRIGFLRALEASDVTLHTFVDDGDPAQRDSRAHLVEALSTLLPERLRGTLVHAEAQRVNLIEQREDDSTVTLSATRCWTIREGAKLVCRDGFLENGTETVPFANASFDGKRWQTAP